MKTTFKRVTTGGALSALVLMVMVSPVGAITTSRIVTGDSKSCVRIKTLATANEAKMNERLSTMQLDFQKRLTNIASRHDTVDQKATVFRAERSDKFDTKVAVLRNKADLTEAQLAAIDEFETAIKTAEATRETAVDTARATYREALDKVVAEHQATLSDAAIVFQKAVKAAFTTAQANCGDTATVASLRASIKTARDSFQLTRKTEAVKSTIKQLADTRHQAVQTADAAFKKSVADAAATLKTALETK